MQKEREETANLPNNYLYTYGCHLLIYIRHQTCIHVHVTSTVYVCTMYIFVAHIHVHAWHALQNILRMCQNRSIERTGYIGRYTLCKMGICVNFQCTQTTGECYHYHQAERNSWSLARTLVYTIT